MLDFSGFDAFVFDLDGTLIDSERFHSDAFAQAVQELTGYAITDAERVEFFKSHTKIYFPLLAERHGLQADVDEVLERKRQLVDAHFVADPIPGALEFVHKWHGKKRYGLVSNSASPFVRGALADLKILTLFDVVRGGDQSANKKPHPEPYRNLLAAMKVSPERTMVFEDTVNGVQSATEAGCRCVFVETGAERDRDALPDNIAQLSWQDLLKIG
ncbi:HAD family hydrolase [Verrucomicrobiota bacterium]